MSEDEAAGAVVIFFIAVIVITYTAMVALIW